MVAKINPHFGLSLQDYYSMDDEQIFVMVDEFEEHNKRVKQEIRSQQQAAKK